MINIKDIRIGNWIIPNEKANHKKIEAFQTQGIFMYSLIHNKARIEFYDYIELTPKILENFGFKRQEIKNRNTTSLHTHYRTILECTFKNIEFVIDTQNFKLKVKMIKSSEYFPIFCVKYLHKLQNLFFELTGVELNDVVAYNYYLHQIEKIKLEKRHSIAFDRFIERIKNNDTEYLSIDTGEMKIEYTLGELPQNLFS